MVSKHIKRHATSLVTRKCKQNPTSYTLSRILYWGEKNQKLQNYHVRQGPEAAGILVTAPGTARRPGCVGTRLSVAGRRAGTHGTHRYMCPRGPQGPWCGRGRSRARARRGAVYGDELRTTAARLAWDEVSPRAEASGPKPTRTEVSLGGHMGGRHSRKASVRGAVPPRGVRI